MSKFAFLESAPESFWYPVTLRVAWTPRPIRIEIKFRNISRDRIVELRKITESSSELADALDNDVEYFMEIAEDWRGPDLVDEKGQPVPFGRETARSLLNVVQGAALAILTAFFDATMGGGAKRKNS